jgi:CBS domain-containing protein
MQLRISRCDVERLGPTERHDRFTAVSTRPPALRGNPVECLDGDFKPVHVCAACAHFLRAVPSHDGRAITIECVLLDSDPVENIMTPVRMLVAIEEDASLDSGAAVARLAGVKQLLVSDDEIVGLADSDEIIRAAESRPFEPVAAVTIRRIPLIARTTPLGVVAAILLRTGSRCLVVADGEQVAGLVTRGDLRRAMTREQAVQ